jgi:hypothetical protein
MYDLASLEPSLDTKSPQLRLCFSLVTQITLSPPNSSNPEQVAEFFLHRGFTDVQCSHRYQHLLHVRNPWTELEDDALLTAAFEEDLDWQRVAARVESRLGTRRSVKQCRERWKARAGPLALRLARFAEKQARARSRCINLMYHFLHVQRVSWLSQ